MEVTARTALGGRSYMEDFILQEYVGDNLLIGVFDGHGGPQCAANASKIFAESKVEFEYDVEYDDPDDPATALSTLFSFVAQRTEDESSGTTATVAYVTPRAVWWANIGDSPLAVYPGGAHNVIWSTDHNVRSNPTEREAAEARGGIVRHGYLYDPQDHGGVGLQMARAFGDAHLARVLSRRPDLGHQQLQAGGYVLIGSDGLYDPAHGAVSEVYARQSVTEAVAAKADAHKLVEDAIKVRRSSDNVSAILVRV